MTFALLIAKRVFDAPSWVKASIQASEHFGLFFNTISLALFARYFKQATTAWCFCFLVTGALFFLSACHQSLWVYAIFMVLAKTFYKQKEPLMIEVYTQNYARNERGKRLSWCLMYSAFMGMLMAHLGGILLDRSLNHYIWICLGMGFAAFAAAKAVSLIPPCPIKSFGSTHPFANISLLWKDKWFGYMKLGWMLLGFGNLVTLPMRTEYLCDAHYGVNVSNKTAALILFVIPAATKIASMRFWGALFDRYSFIPTRIALNACWLIGLFLFFNFKSLIYIGIGSGFIGLAMGGGMLLWTLWVTQVAPPDKVSAYMSAHTAIAGLRGLVSPYLAYALLSLSKNVVTIGWFGMTFTLASTFIFISLIFLRREKDKKTNPL